MGLLPFKLALVFFFIVPLMQRQLELGCRRFASPAARPPCNSRAETKAPALAAPASLQVLLARGLSPSASIKDGDGRKRTLLKTWYNSNRRARMPPGSIAGLRCRADRLRRAPICRPLAHGLPAAMPSGSAPATASRCM